MTFYVTLQILVTKAGKDSNSGPPLCRAHSVSSSQLEMICSLGQLTASVATTFGRKLQR